MKTNSKLFKTFFLSFVLFNLLWACNNNDSEPSPSLLADVIVINEGNFGSSDAALSTYNSLDETVSLSVFAQKNGFPFGAIIQNAILHEERIYVVCQNPSKVEVLDAQSFESIATIQPSFADPIQFANPFGIAVVGNKAFVSNWGTYNSSTFGFDNSFLVEIDLSNFSIAQKIDRAIQAQNILAHNGNIYISNVGANSITRLNPDNLQTTDITTASSPDAMQIDANGNLWVLCRSGNLQKIDLTTNTVSQTISDVPVSGFNEKMAINSAGNKLYVLSSTGFNPSTSAVYEISASATTAPSEALITGENFYGIGVHPSSNFIYLSDNNGFQGNGTCLIYSELGSQITSFAAGRGPNGFLFR